MNSELITGRNGGQTTRSVSERVTRPLRLATIEAYQRKSVAASTARGTTSPARNDVDSLGCAVN
nr:hypothetical protein [Halocatena pleomorpha]